MRQRRHCMAASRSRTRLLPVQLLVVQREGCPDLIHGLAPALREARAVAAFLRHSQALRSLTPLPLRRRSKAEALLPLLSLPPLVPPQKGSTVGISFMPRLLSSRACPSRPRSVPLLFGNWGRARAGSASGASTELGCSTGGEACEGEDSFRRRS